MKQVRIHISGHAGSGKTTLGHKIASVFRQAGINVKMVDDITNGNPSGVTVPDHFFQTELDISGFKDHADVLITCSEAA
jgi:thymidylate kinase